jgi:hypothetical protein
MTLKTPSRPHRSPDGISRRTSGVLSSVLMSSLTLRVLLVASCALLAVPAVAQNKIPMQPPPPGEGGDAVLPAGYKTVRWGINDKALQHVLERGLEMAPGMDHHRHWLIDTPASNNKSSKRGVVKFHFWDSQLFEVTIYYSLTASEGKELVGRFEGRFGDGNHDVVEGPVEYATGDQELKEEQWQWKDPFTLQILRRQLDGERWTLVRQSRVLEHRRLNQERTEREKKRENKIDEIELD